MSKDTSARSLGSLAHGSGSADGAGSASPPLSRLGRAGFFVGQAVILLTYPLVSVAALRMLPTFAEAQANEGLILSLCAYVPLVFLCGIIAWMAYAKKRELPMLVATLVPLILLAGLVYLAIFTE